MTNKEISREAQNKIYKEEIEPCLLTLKNICNRYNMPMFTVICKYAGDKGFNPDAPTTNPSYEYDYSAEMVSPYDVNCYITPDKIADCIKVMVGIGPTNKDDAIDIPDIDVPTQFTNS